MLLESHKHPTIPRLTLDRRADSPFYQARAFIDGKQRGTSTKTDDIRTAFRVAESWYKQQSRPSAERAIDRLGLDPIMADTYAAYIAGLDDKRRAEAAKRWGPVKAFWAPLRLMEIGPKTFRAFYAWRRRTTKHVKAHTLHKDTVIVRQILKHAVADEQLDHLPMIPSPGKIEPDPPPPLSEAEWQHLCAVSQKRIGEAPNVRTKQQRVDCDHFMRLLVASCARVDEIRGLRFRDCRYRLAEDGSSNMLVATVTGKRGTRDIVADTDAFAVVSERPGKPGDRIFPSHSRDAFRELLIAANLRVDVKGRVRNAKALRSTAICRALLGGKDVVFVAKNAGTSIDVISRYYSKYLTAEMAIRQSHPLEVPVSEGRD
jgi:integrase